MENTKLAFLYIMDFLIRETDENHKASTARIQDMLKEKDIIADRRTVYRDIDALQAFGMDILHDRNGYYLASRTFEISELKIIADLIQCSRSVTKSKSRSLISKLQTLTSIHQAKTISRHSGILDRAKSSNETIYYSVDALLEAIEANLQVSFLYYHWKKDGTKETGEKEYRVSPFALYWDNDYYYLIAFYPPHGISHFRVDRMTKISILDTIREGDAELAGLDLGAYSRQVFGMYNGRTIPVSMWFHEQLAANVIDRFGEDITLVPHDNGFSITADVSISPVFFSWVFSFGGRARIQGPPDVVQEYVNLCRKILSEQERFLPSEISESNVRQS